MTIDAYVAAQTQALGCTTMRCSTQEPGFDRWRKQTVGADVAARLLSGWSLWQTMDIKTHLARVTAPISYLEIGGQRQYIPVGPCLVQSEGALAVDIVWGDLGESSIALPRDKLEAARKQGQLVLLD